MAEQPATAIVGDRHAPEAIAVNPGDPVVPREPLVDEGVVGRQQVDDAAVLLHDAGEEQLGLAPQRLPQVVVEIGERRRIRPGAGEVPQIEPLPREVLDHRLGARVGQHPLHLSLERGGIPELAALRRREQHIVRDAAPQEEGEPRGDVEIRQRVDRAGLQIGRLGFEPEDERRAAQHEPQRELDAAFEVAVPPLVVVEREQPVELGCVEGPAISEAAEPRQDRAGARALLGGCPWTAAEDSRAAWRVGRPRRIEWAGDQQPIDVGQSGLRVRRHVAAEERFVELLGEHRRLADERRNHRVTSRGNSHPDAHRLVRGERLAGRLGGILLVDHHRPIRVFPANRKEADPLAVEHQLQLVLFRDPADRAGSRAPEPHADLVLGIDGEILLDAQAAACAERQIAQVIILRQVLRRRIGRRDRGDPRAADGHPADLPRHRDVAFEQQR